MLLCRTNCLQPAGKREFDKSASFTSVCLHMHIRVRPNIQFRFLFPLSFFHSLSLCLSLSIFRSPIPPLLENSSLQYKVCPVVQESHGREKSSPSGTVVRGKYAPLPFPADAYHFPSGNEKQTGYTKSVCLARTTTTRLSRRTAPKRQQTKEIGAVSFFVCYVCCFASTSSSSFFFFFFSNDSTKRLHATTSCATVLSHPLVLVLRTGFTRGYTRSVVCWTQFDGIQKLITDTEQTCVRFSSACV